MPVFGELKALCCTAVSAPNPWDDWLLPCFLPLSLGLISRPLIRMIPRNGCILAFSFLFPEHKHTNWAFIILLGHRQGSSGGTFCWWENWAL